MNIRASIFTAAPVTLAALLLLANCSSDNTGSTVPQPTAGASASAGAGGSHAGAGGAPAAGAPATAGAPAAGAPAGGAPAAGAGGSATAGGSSAGGGAVNPGFAALKQVISTSCYGPICHDLPEQPLYLKVDDATLYNTLKTHMTSDCGATMIPGNGAGSAIIKLMKGACGETIRMPYGKCNNDGDPDCVPPATIATIEQWITSGAPQN